MGFASAARFLSAVLLLSSILQFQRFLGLFIMKESDVFNSLAKYARIEDSRLEEKYMLVQDFLHANIRFLCS